jgi:integrase
MNRVLIEVLGGLNREHGSSDLVFPAKGVRTSFENACRRAGLQDFTFHDLRRTFGTSFLERGIDIVTIQKLYGHSGSFVTQQYLHPCDELKKEAVELLAGAPMRPKNGQNCDVSVTRRKPGAEDSPELIYCLDLSEDV